MDLYDTFLTFLFTCLHAFGPYAVILLIFGAGLLMSWQKQGDRRLTAKQSMDQAFERYSGQ